MIKNMKDIFEQDKKFSEINQLLKNIENETYSPEPYYPDYLYDKRTGINLDIAEAFEEVRNKLNNLELWIRRKEIVILKRETGVKE